MWMLAMRLPPTILMAPQAGAGLEQIRFDQVRSGQPESALRALWVLCWCREDILTRVSGRSLRRKELCLAGRACA